MTALEIEQKKLIEKQEKEIKLLRQLATKEGFFQYYFSNLKNHKSQTECFHFVNDIYFDFFNEYRYSNYDSFKKILKRYYKK